MSPRSSSNDQYGEIDVDPSRYSWALRRAGLPIAGAAVLAGLAASSLLGNTQFQMETRFVVQSDLEVLGATGLDDSFDPIPTPVEANEFVKGVVLVDQGLTATSLIDPAAEDVLSLTVTSSSELQADADTQAIVGSLNAWITERRAAAVVPLRGVVDSQSTDANNRLSELDGEIATLDGQDTLRDAYLAERSDLNSAILFLDRQDRALQSYADPGEHLAIVGRESNQQNSRVLWLAIGIFLGALLAAVVVVVRAHGDRRVRSRSELRTVTDSAVLSVLPAGGVQMQPAQSSLHAAARRLGVSQSAFLVPVDGVKQVSVDAISDGFEIYSMLSGTPLADGSQAVVVAAWGKTHVDDVAMTCQNLRAMGCDIAGCVLQEVPEKQLRRSMA